MQDNWLNKTLFCFSMFCILIHSFGQDLTPKFDDKLSPQEWFEKGNEAYENGHYKLASEYYSAIDSSELHSAEVFQNLGNSHYKLSHIPEAVYYFEKAIKHNPGNEDLIYNLELANKRVIDKNEKKTSSGILSWISSSIGNSPDFWARLTLLSVSIGVLLISLPMIFKHIKFKSILKGVGLFSILIGLLLLCFASIQYNEMNSHAYAISFDPSAEIKNEPSESSSSAFVLHEGSKMEILDENKKWYKVQFNDQVGWIQKTDIKPI